MSKELLIKKCYKCGAIIKVMEDCNCSCGFTHCKYVPGSKIYSYCNKHGLWKKDVE